MHLVKPHTKGRTALVATTDTLSDISETSQAQRAEVTCSVSATLSVGGPAKLYYDISTRLICRFLCIFDSELTSTVYMHLKCISIMQVSNVGHCAPLMMMFHVLLSRADLIRKAH